MSSTKSSPKRIEKVSSDNIVISFDLLSNLTYMATLSAAQLPRDQILQRTGGQTLLQTSVFFEQVHLLAQRLGVEYTRALQMVAAKARAPNIKSLLLRFSNTIATGESEHAFIREETRIEGGATPTNTPEA
jgi:flagellar protein FlaJ